MVLSWLFWILNYVPFIPKTPIIVFTTVWILHPKYKGEGVAYLIMSDYFNTFQEYVTKVRNVVFNTLMWFVLNAANLTVQHCKDKTSGLYLAELRKLTE